MKKTLISPNLLAFPKEYHSLLKGNPIYDSSCSKEATVYYIPRGEGFYLKKAPKDALKKEASLASWFFEKGLAPKVLDYRSEEEDWLLTAAAKGEDCTHYCHEPEKLCDLYAKILRALHEMPYEDCPEQHRMISYFANAEKHYKMGQFDLSYGNFESAEEAWRLLEKQKHLLQEEALIHGDYCLPNVLLKDWKFSSFIDVGSAGVGDRHVDLYWAIWTLQYNLKTSAFASRFKEAYGKHLIDEEKLRLISACEIFG